MSKYNPFDDALTEKAIEFQVSVANRAIAEGRNPSLVLAALEVHLIRGLRALLESRSAPRDPSKGDAGR